jgi:hypothetical protein
MEGEASMGWILPFPATEAPPDSLNINANLPGIRKGVKSEAARMGKIEVQWRAE